MYIQKKVINVTPMYMLAVNRKNVDAAELYKASWEVFEESKIVDLSKVKVLYPEEDGKTSKYGCYSELPEEVKQVTALAVCLIGRWFNDLHSGRDTIMERFQLTCIPTNFWHDTGIFKNDDIKCKNMEELIQKIVARESHILVVEPKK